MNTNDIHYNYATENAVGETNTVVESVRDVCNAGLRPYIRASALLLFLAPC